MIRRESNSGWLCITQGNHARLAHELAAAWGNGEVPKLPLQNWLLPAIREHDAGWWDWERTYDFSRLGADQPRSFTEMVAADSVAIWRKSIDEAASGRPSFASALRAVGDPPARLTGHEAVVIETLLQGPRRFLTDEWIHRLQSEEDLPDETAENSLQWLEVGGVIRPAGTVLGEDYWEVAVPRVGVSPMGGLWVSLHFQALATAAIANREDQPDEGAVYEQFVESEQLRCDQWRDAVSEFAGAELERVIDSGLRYLQFFDRISLWLCMAERDESWTVTLGRDRQFEFQPLQRRILRVTPWPFGERALELSVPAFDGENLHTLSWRLEA